MNQISLIGIVQRPPTYHCTHQARDVLRFVLRTKSNQRSTAPQDRSGTADHHCTAWGPAALCLHQYLKSGDQILIRGELEYRTLQPRTGGKHRYPEIVVSSYTYLSTRQPQNSPAESIPQHRQHNPRPSLEAAP